MKVKGQLEQAQLENVQTADEASLNTAMGMAYYNKETNEILIGKNGSLGRLPVVGSSSYVGDVRTSSLTEAQYQTEADGTWVLADGRDVTGSVYETITGNSTIPDLRGIFLRGKNNGRSDGNENPDGELATGTFQDDEIGSHTHSLSVRSNNGAPNLNDNGYYASLDGSGTQGAKQTAEASGGNETRPKAVTVNYFIKINR